MIQKYFPIWKGIKEGKEDFHAAGMSRCSSVWPADYSGLIKGCLLPAHGAAVAIRRIFIIIVKKKKRKKKKQNHMTFFPTLINKWFKEDEDWAHGGSWLWLLINCCVSQAECNEMTITGFSPATTFGWTKRIRQAEPLHHTNIIR